MVIKIKELATTYRMYDGEFLCEHETSREEEWVEDHIGFDGHYQEEGIDIVCDNPECEYTFKPDEDY